MVCLSAQTCRRRLSATHEAAVVRGGARQQEALFARPQQMFHVGHPAADPTAGHRLEVPTVSQHAGAQLLRSHGRISHRKLPDLPPSVTQPPSLTSWQCLATAKPSGCSLLASAVPTRARIFLRGIRAISHSTSTRVTRGTPFVMVPVLSNITTRI